MDNPLYGILSNFGLKTAFWTILENEIFGVSLCQVV